MHVLEIVGGLGEERALVLHVFYLMPNHYDLLVSTPGGGLSRWMRHVNGEYVRWFNSRHGRVGHLWRGRYRAKITRPAERYMWSSCRDYVAGPRAVEWVETRVVLERFSGDQDKYKHYVEAGKGEKLISPFERATAGLVLGSEEFVTPVRKIVKSTPDGEEQPSRRALLRNERIDPVRVEEAVFILFADSGAARRGRLLLYAQRMHPTRRSRNQHWLRLRSA